MDEWEEKCNLCGRMTSQSKDGVIFRLIKDDFTFPDHWEELCVICVTCFTDMFFSGVRLRGGLRGKDNIPQDHDPL